MPTVETRLSARFPFLYVAFVALLTLPILLPSYPPLVDYPGNLARADILARYGQVELFRTTYRIQRVPLANLATDLVVPPLARIIGTFPAGKVFLVLVLAVYAAGCYLLCSVTQRGVPWLALLLLCFFFNTAVTNGFTNYIAGMAVYLVTFTCWLRWHGRWTAGGVIGFALLALCCYLAHLSSIVSLGISVFAAGSWELRAGRLSARSALWTAAGFVVPAVLFVIFMRGPGQIGSVGWNTLFGKIIDLPLVLRTYNWRFDIMLLGAAVICVLLWLRAASGISVHAPTLTAGLALLLCFFLSPKDLFTSNVVDLRFVWPATVLIVAALRPRIPSRAAGGCLACLILLWTVRTAVIGFVWEALGSHVAQMIRVLDQMPRGASVYPVTLLAPGFDATKRDAAVGYMAGYAVITRDAYLPAVVALASQQPIVQKSGLPYIPWSPGHAEVWRGFDYVWTYNASPELRAELGGGATLVAGAAGGALWRLRQRGAVSRSDLHSLPSAPPKH